MRILAVTNMYPTRSHPADGVFVAREVQAIRGLPGVEVEVLFIDTIRGTGRYVSGMRDVRRAVRSFRPDLVHVHFGLTLLPALAWRGPLVTTFHGTDLTVGWKRRISGALVGRSARAIVVSPQLASLLPVSARSVCISCGNPPGAFAPADRAEMRERLGWDRSATIAGFVSHGDRPVKDRPLFEKAASAVRERRPLESRVLSAVHPDEMPSHLNALDVLLLTSVSEGSPAVTKEALCCGVRVVSVDVGDVARQLEGMSGCRCVPSRDPEAIADAVIEALGEAPPDPVEARRRFSIDDEAAAVLAVYEEVLASR